METEKMNENDYMKKVRKLAMDINQYAYYHDTYDYNDRVDSGASLTEEIVCYMMSPSLYKKEITGIKNWLTEIIEDCQDPEDVSEAKEMLKRIIELTNEH